MSDLQVALNGALAGLPVKELAAATNRLIAAYRDARDDAPPSPILNSRIEVAAYAAYRMPATFAAVTAALRQAAALMPDFRPVTQLDVGGGTGAAAWAAAAVFTTLTDITVVDQVPEALAFGKRLLPGASWRRAVVGDPLAELPRADLITASYVLNELKAADQASLVTELAGKGSVIALLEPGTPAGYERILLARDVLLGAGLRVVAPCPHQVACPLPAGRDWCHFTARLNRSALHRAVKEGASLSFEDEKFSYLVATALPAARAGGRILRQPAYGKGMVTLRVCDEGGEALPSVVSKRHGPLYRHARNVTWGDSWPAV